jgi:dephospho-CoA kinase
MALVVGLTGGIGSGKTVVSDHLKSLGVPIIDTDVIAREIVEPNSPTLKKLAERFGQAVINQDGSLNRDELRQIAFSSKENKRALDSITHPAIREICTQRIVAVTQCYCLVVVPLLVGSAFIDQMDRILVVTAERETKVKRVMTRSNLTRQEVDKIMASQSTDQQRLEIADDVIANDGTIEDAQRAAEELHVKYLKLASDL